MFIAYLIMAFAILFPLVVLKFFFMQKSEEKKNQILHNEGILIFGAPRKKEEIKNSPKKMPQETQKHSYLWLYEEED